MVRWMAGGVLLAAAGTGLTAHPAAAQAGTRVTRLQPAPQIPAAWSEPTLLSPSGRWALFHSYGPGSSQENIHIADLAGKRRPASVGYARDPLFVQNGGTLAYWHYDLAGGSGLYLRNLETGQERRVYPATEALEQGGKALQGNSGTWNPATGELFFLVSRYKHPDVQYAIRLDNGRLRRLGESGPARLTAAGGRTAFTRTRDLPEFGVGTESVWVSGPGRRNRRLAAGRGAEWLDNGRHLLVSRQGGVQGGDTRLLYRVNADTRAERLLLEHPAPEPERLAPGRGWLGVQGKDRITLVSTEDGRAASLSTPGITDFFWGATAGTLYYKAPAGWQRAEIRIEGGKATPPAPVRPGTVKLPLSPPAKVSWEPLEPYQGPWKSYHAAPAGITSRQVGAQRWVGTSQGLRVLDSQGKEQPLLPWQAALRGFRVDWIEPEGDSVYLAARRAAPYNANEWESRLIRADLTTRRAEQRAVEATGFGGGYHLQEVLPGRPFLALVAPYRRLELLEAGTVRHLVEPSQPEQNFITYAAVQQGDGSVWLGSLFGLYLWHPENGTAEHWTVRQGLPAAPVLSLARLDRRLWIGTAAGLVTLDPETGALTPPPTDPGLEDDPIVQLLPTPETLYAVTDHRLAALDLKTRQWTRWALPPGRPARLRWEGRRLVGSFGKEGPLLTFDGRGGWKAGVPLPTGGPPANAIFTLHWREGQLWCGLERAVARLDPATGEWKNYPLPADARNVQHLTSEGDSLFIALFKGGVVELNVRTGAQRRFLRPRPPGPGEESGDDQGSALSVLHIEADARYAYALTHLGMYRLDRRTGEAQDFARNSFIRGGDVLQADEKAIWLLTDGRNSLEDSLVRVSLPDMKIQTLPNPLGLRNFGTYAREPGRGFWYLNEGLTLANVEGRTLVHYPQPRRFRTQWFQTLAWSPGFLWQSVAGRDAGDPYRTLATRLALENGEWQELPPCPLTGVTQMLVAGDSLWMSTRNGLARLPLAELNARPITGLDEAPLPPEQEIFVALIHKDFAEVKQLLESGVPVEVRSADRQTPLMYASSAGWLEMIRFLLDKGASVNAISESGGTPLTVAPNVEVARLLLERGANPNVKDGKEGYPLLIERLMRNEELKIARLLIEKGTDVNVQEPLFGLTPLLAAVQFRHYEFVRPLLDKGAKVNVGDKDGNTPLVFATGGGEEDQAVLRLLLERGAEVNRPNKQGDTALHAAARSYGSPALQILLQHGANLEAVGGHGWTPLLAAAASVNFDAVTTLVKAGANVNARSKSGQTTLMFAARRGSEDAVKLLLSRGAQVNVKDREGKTASKMARESGFPAIAKLLAAAGEKQ